MVDQVARKGCRVSGIFAMRCSTHSVQRAYCLDRWIPALRLGRFLGFRAVRPAEEHCGAQSKLPRTTLTAIL